jgi:hypothetical protein
MFRLCWVLGAGRWEAAKGADPDVGIHMNSGRIPAFDPEERYLNSAKHLKVLVGVIGIEPTTPASRRQCSTRLSYTPTVAGGIAGRPANCKASIRLFADRHAQSGAAQFTPLATCISRIYLMIQRILASDTPPGTGGMLPYFQ